MKLKQLSLIFAITGTLLLYFLSLLSKPVVIDLIEIPNYEGKKIITQGIVKEYFTTKYASQMITIKDENFSAIVYVEGTTDVEYGDKISVTGEIQKYKEDWEIMVSDKKNLQILEKWENISLPVRALSRQPLRYLDLNVNVTGVIDVIYNSFFNLVDLEANTVVPVYFDYYQGANISSGKKVVIFAKFLFDEQQLRYKLVLCDEKHGVFYA
jgi:hypothetical protein